MIEAARAQVLLLAVFFCPGKVYLFLVLFTTSWRPNEPSRRKQRGIKNSALPPGKKPGLNENETSRRKFHTSEKPE